MGRDIHKSSGGGECDLLGLGQWVTFLGVIGC